MMHIAKAHEVAYLGRKETEQTAVTQFKEARMRKQWAASLFQYLKEVRGTVPQLRKITVKANEVAAVNRIQEQIDAKC